MSYGIDEDYLIPSSDEVIIETKNSCGPVTLKKQGQDEINGKGILYR